MAADTPRRLQEDSEETEAQRLDRELIELLNGLRVVMPGAQVLFGFLLTVPFQQGFERITETQRHVYFFTLLLAAASIAFLIAPSAYHRMLFREFDKPLVVRRGSHQALIGTGLLGLAMTGALVLISDIMFAGATVYVVGAGAFGLFFVLWFGLGVARKLQDRGDR